MRGRLFALFGFALFFGFGIFFRNKATLFDLPFLRLGTAAWLRLVR